MREITEYERKKIEKNPPSEHDLTCKRPRNIYMSLSLYTALSIFERVWKNAPKNSVVMIALPLGTSYFRVAEWTPEQAVFRLMEHYGVNATTLARWCRNLGRKSLDEYDAENPIPVA